MKKLKNLNSAAFPRRYIPKEFLPVNWELIEPLFKELLTTPLPGPKALRKWLLKWSELESVVAEEGTRREIAMTCNTGDEIIRKKHLDFVKNISPEISRVNFELSKKYYNCPHRREMGPEYAEFDKMIAAEIELFREENVPLETEVDELCQQYQEITGSWTVAFDGKEQTFPEMSRYLKEADRSVRERAWRAMTDRRMKDAGILDLLYDRMLEKRDRIARQAGLPDYRAYVFKEHRRDYTPDECLEFHESVEKAVVPLVAELYEKRRKALGLNSLSKQSLAPWDLECDPKGLPPLKPFSTIAELQDGVEEIFGRIDPQLKHYFHAIRSSMDLDSRKGKAPGGYQATLEEQRLPFIFTNAAHQQGDVETLLHEGGHAFHTLQCRHQELLAYRNAPMEFCEVASMSQELLGGEHFGVFYKNPADAARSRRDHLESVLELFPWVMTVDAFQHWVYTHPRHAPDERGREWVKEHNRFNAGVDWSVAGPETQSRLWQRQLHIFLSPFYYIEYAISQLGALQIFRNAKKGKKEALEKFMHAMSLGGSRSCREIYKEAGIEFRFDLEFVKELTGMVGEELNDKGRS